VARAHGVVQAGAAFSPLVLLAGGMSLVGAYRSVDSLSKLGLPLAMVVVKVRLSCCALDLT
jgi:hypothetical protein